MISGQLQDVLTKIWQSAREQRLTEVGVEHLLLGILGDAYVSELLNVICIDLNQLRERLSEFVAIKSVVSASGEQIEPKATDAYTVALRVAILSKQAPSRATRNATCIDVLLTILKDNEKSDIAVCARNLGVTIERIKNGMEVFPASPPIEAYHYVDSQRQEAASTKVAEDSLEQLISKHIAATPKSTFSLHKNVFETKQEITNYDFDVALDLRQVQFNGGLSLKNCVFHQSVELLDCDVSNSQANFHGSEFRSSAEFAGILTGQLILEECRFLTGVTVRVPIGSELHLGLSGARLGGKSEFVSEDFQPGSEPTYASLKSIEAVGIVVDKESSIDFIQLRPKYILLSQAILQDKSTLLLNGVKAEQIDFDEIRQVDKANILIDDVNLDGARFAGSNLERVTLSNVNWPKMDGRLRLFEELEWRRGRWNRREATDAELNLAFEKLVGTYRQLISNYEGRRNYEIAEEFYISEMEMIRHQRAAELPKWLGAARRFLNVFWLYKAMSKYGSSYARALVTLVSTIAVFVVAFMLCGVNYKPTTQASNTVSSRLKGFEYDLIPTPQSRWPGFPTLARDSFDSLALCLSIVTLQKDPPLEPRGVGGAMIAAILILVVPAELALFLFALRRRFRRGSL